MLTASRQRAFGTVNVQPPPSLATLVPMLPPSISDSAAIASALRVRVPFIVARIISVPMPAIFAGSTAAPPAEYSPRFTIVAHRRRLMSIGSLEGARNTMTVQMVHPLGQLYNA